MSKLCIYNVTLIRHPQPVEQAAILIEDGRIGRIGLTDSFDLDADTRVVDGSGLLLAPGFIDLQLNGGFGLDFTTDPTTIWPVAAQLPQFGVTAFLPTIITSPLSTIARAQQVLKRAPHAGLYAAPLGLHVEGPYLNPAKKGAHNASHLRAPNSAETIDWRPDTGVRLVTLAPELDGARTMIGQLADSGVIVSAGHSMATVAEAAAAVDNGIRYGTHLFNAMPPLHHRQPGLSAVLLDDARITIGLIPDGVHVHPTLVRLVWRLAAGRINVVTDAMAAMGCQPGSYQLGDYSVTVDDATARLPDGTLAGSIVTLDLALRNLLAWTGCSVAEAVRTVTEIPADLLRLPHKGRVAVGCDADLVLLTPDLHVHTTIISGEIAYAH